MFCAGNQQRDLQPGQQVIGSTRRSPRLELGALAMGEIKGACNCQDQQSAWSAHDTGIPDPLLKFIWVYKMILTAALAYETQPAKNMLQTCHVHA